VEGRGGIVARLAPGRNRCRGKAGVADALLKIPRRASRNGNTDVSCYHCIAKNTYVFGNVVMGLNRNSIHRSRAQAVIEEIMIESDVAFSLKQCLPHTILVEKISIDQIVVICSIPT